MKLQHLVLSLLLIASPTYAQDAIDLSRAQIVNAPDVRAWPPTAHLTSVSFQGGVTRVAFTKQDGPNRWPDVRVWGDPSQSCAMVSDGCLQYTLWLFVKNGDGWAGSAFIQFWHGRDGSGSAADPDVPSKYDSHWYYAPRWTPVFGHGPIQPGEQIAFMVTAGNARDNAGPFPVQERSNVVVFAATDNGAYTFDAGPPPVPTPPVVIPPVVVPPVVTPPVTPPSSPGDTAAVLAKIEELKADVDAGRAENQAFYAEVGVKWRSIMTFAGKYIAPAIAGVLGGLKLGGK